MQLQDWGALPKRGGILLAIGIAFASTSATAQTVSGDRIDAIEKQINPMQGQLKLE
jgi:hypothetical protein